MQILLIVLGVLFSGLGLLDFASSKNVMGQIVSGEFILAGAVFLSCGIVALTIQKLHTTVALAATATNNSRDRA